MPHDPRAAIFDTIEAVERPQRLSSALSEVEFIGNEPVQWAIFGRIVILGEAAGRLDRMFQGAHPEVPWSRIIRMRHRLVHGYDIVDWVRVWKTLESDLPTLLKQLKELRLDEGRKRI